MDLPEKLRAWRGTRRQVDVAATLGISQPLLSMYEGGQARPPEARLLAMLKLYEVPPEEWGAALTSKSDGAAT